MEKRSAGHKSHRHFHCVHQIEILFPCFRATPHAENSILAVKVHADAESQVIGDQIRDAPTEIHIRAVGQLEGRTLRNLLATEPELNRHSESLWPARCDAQRSPGSSRFRDRWTRPKRSHRLQRSSSWRPWP